MVATIDSPVEYPHLSVDGEVYANGKRLADKGHAWMERHESDFVELMRFAHSMQAQKRAGCSRDMFKNHCFQNGIKLSDTRGLSFDNTLWAVVARYMAIEDPSLVGMPLTFRASAVDAFGLLPVSWMGEDDG